MKTKRFLFLPLLLPIGMAGCMGPGNLTKAGRDISKTLKNETVIIDANTPWGPQRLVAVNSTNTSVTIARDGTVSVNPRDWSAPQVQSPGSVTVSAAPPTLQVTRSPSIPTALAEKRKAAAAARK